MYWKRRFNEASIDGVERTCIAYSTPTLSGYMDEGGGVFVVVRKQSDERRGWVGGGVGARKGNGR